METKFLFGPGKDKVFSVHVMKTCMKGRGITPLILNLGTNGDEW